MLAAKRGLSSTILMIFLIFYPHAASADIFKSAEFLEWKRDSQEFYIRTSVGMAGLIVSRNDKKQADCLEDWYLKDLDKSNDAILETMRKFPDFHPRGVIVAVLEKQCGAFVYVEK